MTIILKALLDTLFYYVGLYFALQGGNGHQRLRYKPSQIVLMNLLGQTTLFKPQGGLMNCDCSPKKLTHYGNEENSQRCLIRLFKMYNAKCHSDGALYMKPLKHPKGEVWY